eukprot:scaffold54879_cov68-Phaeocystis_antarctica.AAC.2
MCLLYEICPCLRSTDFFSRNCIRELDSTFSQCKPYLVVHEADEERGGQSLEVLQADCFSCRPELAAVLFKEDPITWHRVADFQLLSLKMMSEFILHATPAFKTLKSPPRLYQRGEVLRKQLVLRSKTVVYVSASNPGVLHIALELMNRFGVLGLKISREKPVEFRDSDDSEESEESLTEVKGATHMLLYLCTETFLGSAGDALAQEVREARRLGLPIVMVHECDPKRNGCPFSLFFRTTPEDLINGNLYGAIANAFHTEPHRQISMANAAKALGAVEQKGGIRKQLSKWVRSAPNSQVGASSYDGVEPTPSDKSKGQGKLTAAVRAEDACQTVDGRKGGELNEAGVERSSKDEPGRMTYPAEPKQQAAALIQETGSATKTADQRAAFELSSALEGLEIDQLSA